jgi:hypothetical protein
VRNAEVLELDDGRLLARLRLDVESLDVPVGADHRVRSFRQQRRDEVEADVDLLHVVLAEVLLPPDRVEDRVVEGQAGDADRRALEVLGSLHLRVRGRHDGVERRRDQRADRDHGQLLLGGEEHVALVEDRDVEPLRRHELQPSGRVRGSLHRHVEVLIVEVPLVLRVEEGGVVGVGEPVERDGERGRLRRRLGCRSLCRLGALVVAAAAGRKREQRRREREDEEPASSI